MCLNGGIPRLTARKGCQFQMIDNKSNNNSNKIKTSHNINKNTTYQEEKCGKTEETGCMETGNESKQIEINYLASSAQIFALPLH